MSAREQEYVVFIYGESEATAPLPQTYEQALKSVAQLFPSVDSQRLGFATNEHPDFPGEMVEIPAVFWVDLLRNLKRIFVTENTVDLADPASVHIKETLGAGEPFNILVKSLAGNVTRLQVFPYTTVANIKAMYFNETTVPMDQQRPVYSGRLLSDDETVKSLDLAENSVINMVLRLRKPVIYVFSPKALSVRIRLSLTHHWQFSAIYPIVPVSTAFGSTKSQSIEWDISTQSDGTLIENTSGLNVSYLFWEANISESLALVSVNNAGETQSLSCQLGVNEKNSVLLPFAKLPMYLDTILASLGLHTEARTSFMTYWLPSFNRYTHVALRFLPQETYEALAPLQATPSADVVTRIFMLFRGLPADTADRELWSEARQRSTSEFSWVGIVGVDVGKTLDSSLMRVIEWGGMEVYF